MWLRSSWINGSSCLLIVECRCRIEIDLFGLGCYKTYISCTFHWFSITLLDIIIQRMRVEDHVGGRQRCLTAICVQGRCWEDLLIFISYEIFILVWILSNFLMSPARFSCTRTFIIGAQSILNLRKRLLILIACLNQNSLTFLSLSQTFINFFDFLF